METLILLKNITGGDKYEITYAHSYPAHWSPTSLYLSDDENGIHLLAPYLNAVFPNFAYYGPQKITLTQWNLVKNTYQNSSNLNPSIDSFFIEVDKWLQLGNQNADHFWILGI